MELTETAKILTQSLMNAGADVQMITSIILMLILSEEAMETLLLFIEDEHPTLREIADKAIMLAKNLPEEARRGWINPDA